MKKYIILVILLVSLVTAGCTHPQSPVSSATTTTISPPATTTLPITTSKTPIVQGLPEYIPGSITLDDQEKDDYPYLRKYRIAYYRIWGQYSELLDDDEQDDFSLWYEETSRQSNYGENLEEMFLVAFVKRYNISREEFDAATAEFEREFRDFLGHEEYEVPNADIIYTFDNEIINYYYRYE